jgi:pyruvate dehydrogenase E2 component (dihydrolipoamide acetyltransferase)
MATIIGLPKLSPTMEEGVLAKWIKKEGESVSPGDVIAEVETDKANMDFPLEDEGTLLKLLVKEGDTVKLGAPVAILGTPGEDVTALAAQAAEAAAAAAQAADKPASAVDKPAPAADKPAPAEKPAAPARAAPAAKPAAAPAPAAGRILASPIAKSLAAEHGIDLRQVRGSGPGGRIVERDVQAQISGGAEAPASEPPAEAAKAEPAARAPAARPAEPAPDTGEEFTDKSLSLMRKTIARRLLEAKQTIPHIYVTGDIDAAKLVAFRADLNAVLGDEHKVSLNDIIIKATAAALVRLPAVNASVLGDRIRTHGRVNIGVAVSIDDGLITPVVRDADRKGIQAIGAEIKELAGRARIRKVLPEEMTGGTFTVSNLGMFGVDVFQAIINPPEAGILAVGTVRKVPVVDGDRIAVGERMMLSLSCDHRVIDGALGARFLAELKKILEHPAILAA